MNDLGLYLDENVSGWLGDALGTFGYDVWTTDRLGRKDAGDVDQISFAPLHRCILITHDADHFELLHEAWRRWSLDWSAIDAASHAGILLLPDPGVLPLSDAARAIDELLRVRPPIADRLLAWARRSGWREIEI